MSVKPTPRQIDLLEGIVATGTLQAAARRIKVTYKTARTMVGAMHARTGHRTEQLIAIGVAEGWLRLPERIETGPA